MAVTKAGKGGFSMDYTVILGIDISKNFADVCALSAQRELLLESKIFYDTAGLQHFLEQIDFLAK